MILTSWALPRNPNPSTRVHPRSEEMDAQMYYSDGRVAWAAVNRRKRKQCAAKECTSHSLLATQTRVICKCIREAKRWTHMCCSDGRTCVGCSERTEVQTCGGFRIRRSRFKLVRRFRIRKQAAANRPLQHTRRGFRSNDKPTNRQMSHCNQTGALMKALFCFMLLRVGNRLINV